MRRRLVRHGFGADKDFRWRGGEISRLDGLSDAVFAFAVTLLVVSLEVPETFDELLRVLRGFFAFAVCFGILFWKFLFSTLFDQLFGEAPANVIEPGRCRC
jgi:Golgi nucleoside diphosphatase